ncbi:hypothetical protein DdX_18241 [Ditylenchus destructor]|uniref:Uncharacterized protein n=1 Tax=Ditylenchus destructor TaxID=166010 RepID=A0AAD4QSY8_9BILA|nr:hypothetical protein DdX_18241 [Ditylenchus destructor]
MREAPRMHANRGKKQENPPTRGAAPLIPTGEPLYDPYTLYLMGIFMATYFYTPAIPVFFLTLDRCIALKFPIHYTKSDFMKRKLPALVITCTFIFTVAILISLLAELPLDIDKVAYCEFFECVTVKYNGIYGKYMKLSVVILNILCTAYFFYALWTFRVFSGERNIFTVKNRVVIVAAASELILNVCPTVFTTVYTNIEQESPSRILGNYTIPLLTLDAVICSVFYVKIYLRKNYQINNAGNRRAGGNVFQINNSISPKGNLDSSSQSNSNRRK